MSRHNKVNKDHYVQRGRLTPDEAARELAKMRQVGSQHKWQPTKKDQLPRFESKPEPSDEGTETTEDSNAEETAPAPDNVQPTKRSSKGGGAKKTAAKAKAAKKTGKAKAGQAKSGKAAKSAAKSAKPPKRQAVLARNVGGLRSKPRPESSRGNPKPKAAKRRKS